jgi:hypothetical protein
MSLLAAAICTLTLAQGTRGTLQGVWRVSEIATSGKNAKSLKSPQPGLYIFTARHYSIMSITADKPRPQFADAAKATADELRDAWGPLQRIPARMTCREIR